MFDSHFHLLQLPKPRELLKEFLRLNYKGESSACSVREWNEQRAILECQGITPNITASYGIHPAFAREATKENIELLESIMASTECSIGECGLDKRFEGYAPGDIQDSALRMQIRLAIKYNRKIVFHIVGDHRRIFKILEEERVPENAKLYFHRFGGDMEAVRNAKKYVSTFGNPVHPEAIEKIYGNTDCICRETDADERFCPMDTPLPMVVQMLKEKLNSQLL